MIRHLIFAIALMFATSAFAGSSQIRPTGPQMVRSLATTANTTAVIPAGYIIDAIVINNTTGNAVTGGIKIGTTSGGTDVVLALAVGANSLQTVPDATILKRVFSMSVDTTLYIQTVTLWNSASLDIYLTLQKVN